MTKAFEFVKIESMPEKPRKKGIVEIRGPYYTSVTYGYLKDLLDDWGEYIDGYKFAGGSMRLLEKERVKQIIDICHDHGVYVSTGGFIERAIVQGQDAVDKYIEECKELGFDVVEVSSGMANIPLEDKVEIVKSVKRAGLKPKPEVSFMVGAGAGTHVRGYRVKLRRIDEVLKEIESHIRAGAEILMLESEGITEDIPESRWRTDIVKKLVKRFGLERWMFEASDPSVFKWYLKNFGKDVSLFIDHSQVVEFTAWKLKLWGDRSIWDGKMFRYRPKT
jgi:phosphosulfolactate synthase (CoM biosynthesis protein A)